MKSKPSSAFAPASPPVLFCANLKPLLLGTVTSLLVIMMSSSAPADATQGRPASLPGLVGDGVTLNTAAINAAIDRLTEAGGGTLSIPPGRYLTGTIYLKSDVTLHLENGAVIVGSTNLADYPENQPPVPSKGLEFGRYSLIYAAHQQDVAITGDGKIDGQGDSPAFDKKMLQARGWPSQDVYLKRPFGLCFVCCRHVQVRNVTLLNTAFWTQDYLDCDDVVVDGVTVDNLRKFDCNTDGIDVDGSRVVRISNCYLVTGDDGIDFKSAYSTCENITVENCIIHALCNGIKTGTASRGGFKNISIANCSFYETGLAGIALEVVDGGVLDGFTVANLSMNDVGTPIFIRLGNRGKKWIDGQGPVSPGVLQNVIFSGITATLSEKTGTLAASITGQPGYPIENITVSNVKIIIKPGFGKAQLDPYQLQLQKNAKSAVEETFSNEVKNVTVQQVPEKPSDYPEYSVFGPLPAYGFFCRHVKNLTFKNIDLSFDKADYRSALAFQDVHGLIVDGLRASSLPGSNPVVVFRDVTDAFLTGCVAEEGTPVFLGVEGDSYHISLRNGDLSRAASAILLQPGMENRHIQVDSETDGKRVPGQ